MSPPTLGEVSRRSQQIKKSKGTSPVVRLRPLSEWEWFILPTQEISQALCRSEVQKYLEDKTIIEWLKCQDHALLENYNRLTKVSGSCVTRNINKLTQVSVVHLGEYIEDPDQTGSSVRWFNHQIVENNSSRITLEGRFNYLFCRNFRKSASRLDLLHVCVFF